MPRNWRIFSDFSSEITIKGGSLNPIHVMPPLNNHLASRSWFSSDHKIWPQIYSTNNWVSLRGERPLGLVWELLLGFESLDLCFESFPGSLLGRWLWGWCSFFLLLSWGYSNVPLVLPTLLYVALEPGFLLSLLFLPNLSSSPSSGSDSELESMGSNS